jgi:glycosyltransferase involved in cell wall biosynthesis
MRALHARSQGHARMTRVGVFHPGAQNSWQRALAAQEAGTLAWYLSSVQVPADGRAMRLAHRLPGGLGRRLERELGRRCCPALDPAALRRAGFSELAEIALRRLHRPRTAAAVNRWGNARFARHVIARAQAEPVDLLWTHNDSALESFAWANARGIRCVLDQSIGHPAALAEVLARDRARYPALYRDAPPLPGAREVARNDRELALADDVLVGSPFARDTLRARGVDAGKIHLIAYGCDAAFCGPALSGAAPARPPLAGRALEVLFAGTLQPRKGLGALIEAFAGIDPRRARLTLLGRLDLPRDALAPLAGRAVHRPPVPRREVAQAMARADVLILPSLFEGSAVVAYEAQAAGLALIQSAHTGLVVRHGATGLLLPEVSAPAIREAVLQLADDPGRLAAMQAAAAAQPPRRWADYRADVRAALGLPQPACGPAEAAA